MIFPFYNILDDEFVYINSSLDERESYFTLRNTCEDISEKCKRQNEINHCNFENVIDSDSFLSRGANIDCDYYTNDEFCCRISNNYGLSVIHFNCRSLKANFNSLQKYLISLNRQFDIIALSETWLNELHNVNEVFF